MAAVDEIGVGGGGNCEDKTVKKSPLKNLNRATDYLTPDARQAFTQLRQAFTEAPILRHFDLDCYIRIETDASGYGMLSQLIDYSRKMFVAKTCYKTHNAELLTIVEVFKTWRHYLKGCKHKVLVLTNHNNLRCFMETKSLSSRQIRCAPKLLQYHF